MNIFVPFGTLLWIVSLAGLSLCLLVLLVVAYVRKSWSFAFRSGIAAIGTIVMVTGMFFGVMYLMFRPYDPSSETELKRAYAADFGKSPPDGITVLKSRQVVISDSGAQWLLLKATPEEIDRHTGMGFTKIASPPGDFRGDQERMHRTGGSLQPIDWSSSRIIAGTRRVGLGVQPQSVSTEGPI